MPPKATNYPAKKSSTGSKQKAISAEELLRRLKSAKEQLAANNKVDIVSVLRSNQIESPLALIGTQYLRIKRTIEYIKENIAPRAVAEYGSYFGSELSSVKSIANLKTSLSNLSLFSSIQLIVIYEADKVKSQTAKPLAEAIKLGKESSLVILAASTANTKTPLLTELDGCGTRVEVAEMSPELTRKWIEKEALRAGSLNGIEAGAVESLLKYYGSDLDSLSRELEKLSLLTDNDKKITKSLTDELCSRSPEANSFQLVDQSAQKQTAKAIFLSAELASQGLHPIQISAFLSRAIRTMIAHKEGSPPSQIPSELDNPWFARNLAKALRLFTPQELVASLEIIKTLDFRLKDNGLPDSLSLSLAIARISRRAFSPVGEKV